MEKGLVLGSGERYNGWIKIQLLDKTVKPLHLFSHMEGKVEKEQ